MKKLITLFTLLAITFLLVPAQDIIVPRRRPAAGGPPSLNRGINFRNSSGFVTDGTNQTFALPFPTDNLYPIARGGLTFGYENTGGGLPGGADRSSGNDPRFAGIHFTANNVGQSAPFRIDLPSTGTYTIHLALGDAGFSQAYTYFELFDDNTSKLIIDKNTSISANSFWDATGVARTAANWPTQNISVNDIAVIVFSRGSCAGACCALRLNVNRTRLTDNHCCVDRQR
jgi:hypothetical protein